MRTLYVATSNPGKCRDFAVASGSHPEFEIAVLPGIEQILPPPENEDTFEGNARSKAIAYSLEAAGLLVFADDSGLEVDALNGAPGVRSARYAEDEGERERIALDGIDAANNALLLCRLRDIPTDRRTARYRCVLALAQSGKVLLTAEGTVEGRIALEPRGSGGFGYDPIFYLPELGKTMAEIDLVTKNSLSHRGRALQSLLAKMSVAEK